MMILTDQQIAAAVKARTVKIAPWSAAQLQPASYDRRVGSEGITTGSRRPIDIQEHGLLTLSPGDFGIVLTRKALELDRKHTARIDLRSKYARKGIIATTNLNVDPGYRGRLKIGLTNLSPRPVTFPFEDALATMKIHSLPAEASQGYNGPDQGSTTLSAEDITAVAEGENMGFAKILDTLGTLSTRVDELTTNVGELTAQVQRHLAEQGELLRERFELAQEQNERQFENIQKQFELTQQQNEKQFEQIQLQFRDIRVWLGWSVAWPGGSLINRAQVRAIGS